MLSPLCFNFFQVLLCPLAPEYLQTQGRGPGDTWEPRPLHNQFVLVLWAMAVLEEGLRGGFDEGEPSP
jgi:hypothetical protein